MLAVFLLYYNYVIYYNNAYKISKIDVFPKETTNRWVGVGSIVNKHKNIALVSLSSAGTEGHLSVVRNLFNYFKGRKFHPIVISECDYAGSFPLGCFSKLKQFERRSELSLGGAIEATYDLQLSKLLNQIKPKAVIFETFFSPSLVKNIKYPCYYVACKLRDTHQELFFKKRFFSLFKKIYFRDEAFEVFETKDISLRRNKLFENVYYCPPMLSIPDKKFTISKRKKIIVTWGGGGLRGSNKMLLLVNEALYNMSLGAYSEIIYVMGSFNQNRHELLLSKKSRQCEYMKDLPEEFKKSRLVISEAGHNTVNELVATNTPALLIPGFRLLDNQEFRAVKSDIFGFDWMFPEYLSPEYLRKKINEMLKRNLIDNNRLMASRLLFRGKNVLLNSLFSEVSE